MLDGLQKHSGKLPAKHFKGNSDFAETYACATCVDSRPLPKTAVDIRVRLASTGTWHGVPAPVMTFRPLGRLGNLMGEYASLYALKNYSVTRFLMPSLHDRVKDVFKRLSIPYLNKCINTEGYAQACPPCSGTLCRNGMISKSMGIPVPSMFEDKDWISIGGDFGWVEYSYQAQQLAAAGLLGPHAFIMEDYPLEITSFAAYRDELRKEFEFLDEIQKKAYDRLASVASSATMEDPSQPLVFVGVHVRLTDYPRIMSILYSVHDVGKSYEGYLRRAFIFFTKRFDNVVFVVTSDDVVATTKMTDKLAFPNTFLLQGSASEDMHLLTLCNHTIITFGSYGFWAGFLGPGWTAYPDLNFTGALYIFSRHFYEAAYLEDFVPILYR
ncbi:galactoside 2-alpha-L-fucosyltransferase Sec1-like [Hyalella azteca]|uniref:L-Fucosyltransferase n=1 Tax=Hyalella azteca TaxID=294128 RepID=A0A979FKK6_HYAAZ|nr:galactoside 2-alpha-L-fucosyltransferase Sec1-like [Hyalella azteca]